MPRDMTGAGRYPPQSKHKPISFYSAVRLGDPEQLATVMKADPYFITQDNGAGAPLHFATTYKQIDMVRLFELPASAQHCLKAICKKDLSQTTIRPTLAHLNLQVHHLLDLGAEINQRDDKGWTPLHRAAYLAHYEGYLEIYEYLLVSYLRRCGPG